MAKKQQKTSETQSNITDFKTDRVKKIQELYADETSSRKKRNESPRNGAFKYATAAAVRDALQKAITDHTTISETSKKLYAINPIYASIIDYMADVYLWRYKVIPRKLYNKSKAKLHKDPKDDDFTLMYNLMINVVDGLMIETQFPNLLTTLYINGAVYLTTCCNPESLTIDTLLLPEKYCRKIGETQYGSSIIQFDFSYFDEYAGETLKNTLSMFPKEFSTLYKRYKEKHQDNWQTLDPHFSTGVLLNEYGIPTYFYLLGGILDYEQYQDNELERNENLLKYLVVHTMPHYEDKLIFEMDEVKALHQSLKKIVDVGDKARLITTYGDVHVDRISDEDTTANEVLAKAYEAIFHNAGFNSAMFISDSVTALEMSLIRDRAKVWRYVNQFLNFYTIAINNWFDFKDYQADIDILQISPYTYKDDIKLFKDNATLGVGKLDYFIASGIKQKDIPDQLNLENRLHLNDITPMQTSYTQSAEDRAKDDNKSDDSKSTSPEIEPSEEEDSTDSSTATNED